MGKQSKAPLSGLSPILLSRIRAVLPEVLARDITSVQPMSGVVTPSWEDATPPSSIAMPGVLMRYTVDLPLSGNKKYKEIIEWADTELWQMSHSPYRYSFHYNDEEPHVWRWTFKSLSDATLFKLRWVGS